MSTPSLFRPAALTLAALAAAVLTANLPAQAATASPAATSSSAARAKYARDTARCRTLPVQSTERANCLSEASTAFAQTQPDKPSEAPNILVANAMRRCDPLPEPDKRDCLVRMQGGGTISGSVASGGILRELKTREVILDPAALPPTAAGPASGVAPPAPAPIPLPTPSVQPTSPTPSVPPAPPVEQVPPAGYPPLPMRPTN